MSNKSAPPDTAMVLAAGLGKRMRPLTDEMPKPLIEVGGRAMLDRALDRLEDAGVSQVVVNSFYKGEMIAAHLEARTRPFITLSPEDDLLDTGGGIAGALRRFSILGNGGGGPFYTVNADVVWLDGRRSALHRLAEAWDDDAMDVLLLVTSTVGAIGYQGGGDFMVEPDGRTRRRAENEIVPFVFTGIQLLHPRVFEDVPDGAFSMNMLFDRAIEQERLFAIVHDGIWFHVGTPDGLREAEEELAESPESRAGRLF